MQSVSSRIWTRVAVSISYDDNHYTTGTSKKNKWYLTVCKKQNKLRLVLKCYIETFYNGYGIK